MISKEVSTTRLYLMRAMYLLNFLMLGFDVWSKILYPGGEWDPIKGAAYSLWAALSLLSVLGLRYPLQLLPLLLFQFTYKVIWLLGIGVPQWDTLGLMEITQTMIYGVALDLVVIPWPYVITHYAVKGGERWKRKA